MSIPAATVDATGYHTPAFADIVAGLQTAYRGIYGQDIAFDASDQDTQWLGLIATAINDANAMGLAVYNAYSPATAQGVGLSSVVKANGITRKVASYSTQTVTVIGQAGIVLTNQTVGDGTQAWMLSSPFTIPSSGTVDVTATCTVLGAVTVAQGTAGQILRPTKGLQFITFSGVTAPGQAVETDAQLRIRQGQSTMLPAIGVVDGIRGAIANLPNVSRVAVYENDGSGPSGNATDANGLPAHTISAVVDGGDNFVIAQAIAIRKLGSGTYGTASAVVTTGSAQIPRTIYFWRPIEPPISWAVTVRPLLGFTIDGEAAIQSALAAWTNGLGIGVADPRVGHLYRIPVARAYAVAQLIGTVYEGTFEIVAGSLLAARDGGTLTAFDPAIAFNEAPQCQASAVTVTVLPS